MNLFRRVAVASVKCSSSICRPVATNNASLLQRLSPLSSTLPKLYLCRSYITHTPSTRLKNLDTSRLSLALRPPWIQFEQNRNITVVSRLGKRKSCKSVLKRFRRVKGGYLKRWRSGMVKKQRKKSSWRKFRLRGSILVKRKSHLRTLNKMMYKH